MKSNSLMPLPLQVHAHEVLAMAHKALRGRSASTIQGGQGHLLRQTLLALVAGTSLGEHETPGEASLQVILGEVVLTTGDVSVVASAGDLLSVPAARHSLAATSDAVVLLTVANGNHR